MNRMRIQPLHVPFRNVFYPLNVTYVHKKAIDINMAAMYVAICIGVMWSENKKGSEYEEMSVATPRTAQLL